MSNLINTISINQELIKPEQKKEVGAVSSVYTFEVDKVETWAFWDDLFTPTECETIIQIGNSKQIGDAKIGGTTEDMLNKKIRDSKVSWLFPGDNLGWAFKRVADAALSLNQQFFGFDLFAMVEGFQFTKYEAPGGNYGRHVDRGMGGSPRKLSLTIQLNSNNDFEGGEFALYIGEEPIKPPMQQGKMVVFPSYTLHEVTPVTKGTRYSLVCWITGKPFK